MKARRHPFILLEVFLALTILSLALIPLSSFPYRTAKKDREQMMRAESERIYSLVYADFLTQCTHTHPQIGEYNLTSYQAVLPHLGSYQLSATVNIAAKKTSSHSTLYALTFQLHPTSSIFPKPKPFCRHLTIEN